MRGARGQAAIGTTTLVGTEAIPVEVQVDVANGLPLFAIVGLGDAAVLEARERVRTAIRTSGYTFPNARIVVNLAPGPLRKHGTGFDLPIALGVLRATGQLNGQVGDHVRAVGELALDGTVRPVHGMLAHALGASRDGLDLMGPMESSRVVGSVPDLRYRGISCLADVHSTRTSGQPMHQAVTTAADPDLVEVCGHDSARRAVEIAAAGGHNLLLVGPPGSGKTMLARRLGPIMPPLTPNERIEAAVIHSVAGLDERPLLAGVRPFRAPHHSASVAGLVGGGVPLRPGEISLAHTGVLFLDELPEFGPACLQTLRQPMEDGHVDLVRADGRVRFPARFALVAAANPCPCGHAGDPGRACRCSEASISRYRSRVGGPLIDRIDLIVSVDRIDPALLMNLPQGESSRTVRKRVNEARERAIVRSGMPTAQLGGSRLLEACRLDLNAREMVSSVSRLHHLSGRSVTRLMKVGRTIADLEVAERVSEDHLYEALNFRGEDLR